MEWCLDGSLAPRVPVIGVWLGGRLEGILAHCLSRRREAGRFRKPLPASILYLSRLFEFAYRSGNANATLRYKVPAYKSFVSGKS